MKNSVDSDQMASEEDMSRRQREISYAFVSFSGNLLCVLDGANTTKLPKQ